MSKVATYLNEHLTGEVVVAGNALANASTDGSVLLQRPEMIAKVANTSDIRKIARFCWQLAEKGHILPMTVRGFGNSEVGSAIGAGVIISPQKYLHRVIGIDSKQKLIHVQSGASCDAVNMTLSTHRGMGLPFFSPYGSTGTIGGMIADGISGSLSSVYGTIHNCVNRLEVVLANGDVLQTERLSKRELNRKKGLHTLEGEIYRKIDNLITDNAELIQKIAKSAKFDTTGYRSIVDVKEKNGSFDLTPLFIGSQGSLGIISEAILQAQFIRQDMTIVIASYENLADAQAGADLAVSLKANSVEVIDGRVLEMAEKQGKSRDFAPQKSLKGGLVLAFYTSFNERSRQRSARKLARQLEKPHNAAQVSTKSITVEELPEIWSVIATASQTTGSKIVPSAFRGLWLPAIQLDGFLNGLRKIESEYSIKLPFYVNLSRGFVDLLPIFDIKKVSDRQKLVKSLASVAELVDKHDGSLAGQGSDGRLKAIAMQKTVDKDVAKLYQQIKEIFDPHGILNPDIKNDVSAKKIVSQLNAWCRASN